MQHHKARTIKAEVLSLCAAADTGDKQGRNIVTPTEMCRGYYALNCYSLKQAVLIACVFWARNQKLFVVMIRYIAPILVTVILVAYVAQTFGLFSM